VNLSVKRIIALTSLWLFAVAALAQAPIGVCLNNVAQTISNGVIAPISYATVALCAKGSTATNCVANKVSIYTSTALSTATPTNPFTADAGGNYFFCAAVGHYALLINSSYGQYFVPDVTLADNYAAGGTMTGALTDAAGFIGPLTGNASTASAFENIPTVCDPVSYFAYGITANGNSLCNALYYQSIQENGTALPQQPILNFDATMSTMAVAGKTSVGLPSIAKPGTYTNPTSITVDANGRVTGSITSGPNGTWTSGGNTNGYWTKDPTGQIIQHGSSTTSGSTSVDVTFPIAFTISSSISFTATVGPTSLGATNTINFMSVSLTGAAVGGNDSVSGMPFNWIAIGY